MFRRTATKFVSNALQTNGVTHFVTYHVMAAEFGISICIDTQVTKLKHVVKKISKSRQVSMDAQQPHDIHRGCWSTEAPTESAPTIRDANVF